MMNVSRKRSFNYPDMAKITGNIHYVPARRVSCNHYCTQACIGLNTGERCTGTARSQTLLSK